MGLIVTLLIGLAAGWATGKLMKGNYSVIVDLALGIVGAVVGGWLTSLAFGINLVSGLNLTTLIVAIIGAVIVVAVYRLIRGRKVV
jgi:uncharacterized membrane protein YeaQ/YmgE (transglycosylase-associated protein family)